jgi:cytochrome c-type biogenesis protein CcmE
MKPRSKFIVVGALIALSAGYLMAGAIRSTGVYYFTPSEFSQRLAADETLHDVGVKVGANVLPGSIVREPGGRSMTFVVTDGSVEFPVSYRGIAPDTFTDGVEVVVEGRMNRDGTFQATTVLAKCASRYEAAPEAGDTRNYGPGYPAPAAPSSPASQSGT